MVSLSNYLRFLVSLTTQQKGQDLYIYINYVTRTVFEEWRHSAKNLIYHFCCVLKGMVPFSISWTPQQ